MAKYKVLASVIHNTGHSLTSDMWWAGDRYLLEALFDAAAAARAPSVEIDALSGVVTPDTVATPAVRTVLGHLPAAFGRLVTSGGAALDMVTTARLRITFDFARSQAGQTGDLSALVWTCQGELVDDRGTVHRAQVRQTNL